MANKHIIAELLEFSVNVLTGNRLLNNAAEIFFIHGDCAVYKVAEGVGWNIVPALPTSESATSIPFSMKPTKSPMRIY